MEEELEARNKSLILCKQEITELKAIESKPNVAPQIEEESEENLEFFKKKLLEAESYIEFIEKEKHTLENTLELNLVKSKHQ